MRKTRLCLAVAAMMMAATLCAKITKVKVARPGTLPTLLSEKQIGKMTDLQLSGTINATDLRFLRTLMGAADSITDKANPIVRKQRLESLDLKAVRLATGGGLYIKGHGIGLADLFPSNAFTDCNVGCVVMPDSVPRLDRGVFERSNVERVVLAEYSAVENSLFCDCPQLREIVFPQVTLSIIRPAISNCPQLRELKMHTVGYISAGGSIRDCENLREITIDGLLGHIDGWNTWQNCPNLETIRFGGYVVSTGGDEWLLNCPKVKDIIFEKAVCQTYFGDPKSLVFQGYTAKGPVFGSEEKEFIAETKVSTDEDIAKYRPVVAEIAQQAKVFDGLKDKPGLRRMDYVLTQTKVLMHDRDAAIEAYRTAVYEDGDPSAYRELTGENFKWLSDDPEYAALVERAKIDGDFIQILRDAPAYEHSAASDTLPRFTYDFQNPILRTVRDSLRLDSIAGNGDEIERIKNVMYWLHNAIQHDGSSSWPECDYNAWTLYKVAKAKGRGYNCRFLAMMLTDCYLALGMPARFVTCASKWTKDQDCHVTVMVWSKQLGKWVWMDPSFAAYITDENGLLLHHGEVRERLINGQPLVLNEDANWNNINRQTKEHYLEQYMAKNLYTLECHVNNRTEAESDRREADDVALIPTGTTYKYGAQYITSDADYFWQAPELK